MKILNLLYEEDLKDKNHFCVILVFNHFNKNSFINFIQSIIEKKPLIAELCTAEYEEVRLNKQYRFESDEGETVIVSYVDVLFYLKLATQKFVDVYADNNEKKIIEKLLEEI